jgi:broad specificity phosphatase PhoE
MVRHSEDYNASRTKGPDKLWDGDAFSLMGRDPVLTENGVRAAADGFTENEATSVYPGYKGIKGGIRGKLDAFQPTLVVASPLRRSLLTTVIACEHLSSETPIIAHPHLREIKSEKTHAKTPDHVKPGAHGVPLSVLRDTLRVTKRGPDVDLSLLLDNDDNKGGQCDKGDKGGEGDKGDKSGEGDKSSEDSWHETGATPAESVERAFQFLDWLKHRPERRVMIFTHGGVLKLDRFGGTRFLHGECRQYTFDGERMIRDDTYDIAQHVIPEDQMMLLKKKDMETLISSTTSTTESMGDQDGKEGGAKTAKT